MSCSLDVHGSGETVSSSGADIGGQTRARHRLRPWPCPLLQGHGGQCATLILAPVQRAVHASARCRRTVFFFVQVINPLGTLHHTVSYQATESNDKRILKSWVHLQEIRGMKQCGVRQWHLLTRSDSDSSAWIWITSRRLSRSLRSQSHGFRPQRMPVQADKCFQLGCRKDLTHKVA